MNAHLDPTELSRIASRRFSQLSDVVRGGADEARDALTRGAHTGRYQLDRLQGVASLAQRKLKSQGPQAASLAVAAARRHPVAAGAILVATAVGAAMLFSPRLRAKLSTLSDSKTPGDPEAGAHPQPPTP